MSRLGLRLHIGVMLCCISLAVGIFDPLQVFAISSAQKNDYSEGAIYFDSSNSQCNNNLVQSASSVTTNANQTKIIQTIIGIAKSEGLGHKGAFIGLMVAQDESAVSNLANSNVPLSLSIPHSGVGSNGNSVGVYQQQVNDAWSTLDLGGPTSLNDKPAIAQLMTPAYAAEAFFGTPPGTKLAGMINPGALTKGLQNITNWQNLARQVAGQEVQNPGNAAGNSGLQKYQQELVAAEPTAQAYLTQYWSSSPSVAPPVAFTAAQGTITSSCSSSSAPCNSTSLASTAPKSSTSLPPVNMAGLSNVRQQVVCIAEQQLAVWESQPGYPWNGANSYSETGYLKYSQGSHELWCADFASWVYNRAKYPLQPDPNWRVPAVVSIQSIGQQNQNFHYHPASSGYTPQPGDLALYGGGHVNIFITEQKGIAYFIGGDQGNGPYPGGSVVSIATGNGYYGLGATAYVSPN